MKLNHLTLFNPACLYIVFAFFKKKKKKKYVLPYLLNYLTKIDAHISIYNILRVQSHVCFTVSPISGPVHTENLCCCVTLGP